MRANIKNLYKISFKKVKKGEWIKTKRYYKKIRVPFDGWIDYNKIDVTFLKGPYFIEENSYTNEDGKKKKEYEVYSLKKDDFDNLYFERLHYFPYLESAKTFIILQY